MTELNTLTHRVALALLAAAVVVGGAAVLEAQEDGFFANTKKQGRAAIEYVDDDIHVVAAYYYSQRNHESRWLLIETAISSTSNLTFDRENVRLLTPEGREVDLPSQTRVSQDVSRIRPVVQNASTTRHGVLAYFSQRSWAEGMRLFSLDSGPVLTNFVTDRHHVALGDLFFESPNGLWEAGTYSLVVERDGVRAVLPIELE
jgi:hypothetical protein